MEYIISNTFQCLQITDYFLFAETIVTYITIHLVKEILYTGNT